MLPKLDPDFNFDSFRTILGLLIIVQGFETTRFLEIITPPKKGSKR